MPATSPTSPRSALSPAPPFHVSGPCIFAYPIEARSADPERFSKDRFPIWTKSPDTDLTDSRLLEAGPLGHHLYHRAAILMSANLTRGHISHRALRSLDDFAGITEDGTQVTLAGLAARLVWLELWQAEDAGFYDLRHEGLNPVDIIEKRRVAGKLGGISSAEVRRRKYGTAQPIRPEANGASHEPTLEASREPKARSKTPKHLEAVPVPVPVDSLFKSSTQVTGFDNSRGRDGDGDRLDNADQANQVDGSVSDASASPPSPEIVLPADRDLEEKSLMMSDQTPPVPGIQQLRTLRLEQEAKRKAAMARFMVGSRVNTPKGDGTVMTVYAGKVVVKLDSDGGQVEFDASELTPIAQDG
jgi:hypothetical protein